jgi:hypothetical protein
MQGGLHVLNGEIRAIFFGKKNCVKLGIVLIETVLYGDSL